MPIILHEIPISHNCSKVRAALKRKGLAYESRPVPPQDRSAVRRLSGQGLVPVIVDGDACIADSTRILLHLEERYPDPPLLPADPAARAECLLLEDWADQAFMALTRRLGYWQVLSRPGGLARAWGMEGGGLRSRVIVRVGAGVVRRRFGLSAEQNVEDEEEARRVAALAVERLGPGPYLMGESLTLADIALASMAAPLYAAAAQVTGDPSVRRLLEWIPTVLASEDVALYRRT